MKRITIRLPDSLASALETRAAAEHRDTSNMVRRILSLELNVPDTEDLDPKSNPELPLP
jgi:plasmid stability protein